MLAARGPSVQIDIVSDTVCPWCFVGKRRLEAALRERPGQPFDIRWHPFQLNPDLPDAGVDRTAYLKAKFGSVDAVRELQERLVRVGRAEGIEFDFERVTRQVPTLLSHCLIYWAGELGRQDAVVEGLFRGHFERGGDLGDLAFLRSVAEDADLDGGEAERRLARRVDWEAVRREEFRYRALGVTAVPFFVLDQRVAFSGAQEPAVIGQVVDRVRAGAPMPGEARRVGAPPAD